ncbi:MAG: DUF370 domain-containing protein [Ruminococcaceae bacterium]|nr:DUF370 domain-containing protein [Oscillospiraceae bacterium]
MYVNLGNNKSVRRCDIVAIFDLDSSTVSVHTRNFLSRAQAHGRVRALGYELPKSFVVMRDETVYLSPFNSSTIGSHTEYVK